MTFSTQTEIANAALSSMGEREIRDYLTDTDPVAVEVRRWFDFTAKEELMKFDWPFAIKRVSVTKDGTAPAFTWASAYAVPSDCVRFFPPTDTGEDTGENICHEVEGGFILANTTDDMKLRYVAFVSDVADWPLNFQTVFIPALALKLAENVTGLSGALSTSAQRYEQATQVARRFEGRQTGSSAPASSLSYIEQR